MSIAGVLEPLRLYRRLLSVDCSTSSEWVVVNFGCGIIVNNFKDGLLLHTLANDTARFGAPFLAECVDRADLMALVAVMVSNCSGGKAAAQDACFTNCVTFRTIISK